MRQSFGPYAPGAGLDEWPAPVEQLKDHRAPFAPAGQLSEDTVESETTPGTYYHLHRRFDGSWSCDCRGYQCRRECKHSRRKQEEKPW